MSSQAQTINDGEASTHVGQDATPAQDAGPFVINLCASATPAALKRPQASELKEFTFFISRRLEDGRERFRLHMGYFATASEAEEWLGVVRELYPAAWVSGAPGRRLRERNADSTAVHPALQATPVSMAPGALRPDIPSTVKVPTLRAAQPETGRKPTSGPARSRAASADETAVMRKPDLLSGGSNVREVLALLEETGGSTREMPAMGPQAASPLEAGDLDEPLSDTQALRILEERHVARTAPPPPVVTNPRSASVPLLNPDDTVTRRVIKDALQTNAEVQFAVQLQWSVQPINIANVPPLAIFSAYTLYTVEGSREGRKWYGLRLGFFDSATSAKQVAAYVRSEFASVAVVPVSPMERTRATERKARSPQVVEFQRKAAERNAGGARAAGGLAPAKDEEFKLIDDPPREPRRDSDERPAVPTTAKTTVASASRPGAAGRGQVHARERRPPQTLEETLEILGANDLEIEETGRMIGEAGVRHLQVQMKKPSSFSRLLDQLTERVRRS